MFVNIKYVLFLLPPYTISDMYIKLSRYVIIIATHVFRVSHRVTFKYIKAMEGFLLIHGCCPNNYKDMGYFSKVLLAIR